MRVSYTSLSQIPPVQLGAALVPRCSSPPTRLAALKLLRELTQHSGANLQTSLSLIKRLHLPDKDPALHDSMPLHPIRSCFDFSCVSSRCLAQATRHNCLPSCVGLSLSICLLCLHDWVSLRKLSMLRVKTVVSFPCLSAHLQIPIEYLCGTQEWWRYMLHECCLPAAFHAALHTQDAAVSA